MSNCLFCKIIRKEIPAKVLYEDELALAFEDINPKAPTHVLVIPKKHLESLESADWEDRLCLGHLVMVARDLARRWGHQRSGYRTVINTGPDAGQSVFHVHLHLLGGRKMDWPPG